MGNKEYERFGDAWRREMMEFKKEELVDMLAGFNRGSFTDLQLSNPKLWDLIKLEHVEQMRKWGVQTHSIHEWLAFAAEELGETSEAASDMEYNKTHPFNVAKEAIQAATLLIKIAEMCLDKGNDADEMPAMGCPKCGYYTYDFDGIGVTECKKCGYCKHVSMTGLVCDACGKFMGGKKNER